MPANKKYLEKSPWIQTSKLVAAFIGGLVASLSLHLALAFWVGFDYIIPTSLFSIFVLWGFFMITVYWIKSHWISWGVLFLITFISVVGIYIAKN